MPCCSTPTSSSRCSCRWRSAASGRRAGSAGASRRAGCWPRRWCSTAGGTRSSCRCCSPRSAATMPLSGLILRADARPRRRAALVVIRHRRQSGRAGLLQIPRRHPRLPAPARYRRHCLRRSHSAPRHQLLHLHPDSATCSTAGYGQLNRDRSLLHYALFVTFFPHLIAGPILHHRDLLPQFVRPPRPGASARTTSQSAAPSS